MPTCRLHARNLAVALVVSLAATIATANGLGPEPTSLSGRYTGFWTCNANTLQIQLDLRVAENGSADATIVPTLLNARRRGSTMPAASAKGSYDAETSTLSLEGPIFPRQPVTNLEGVVQADGAQLALFPADRFGTNCSALLAARGDKVPRAWRTIPDAAKRTAGISGGTMGGMSIALERSRDQSKTTCDDDILNWVRQLRDNGYTAEDSIGLPQKRNLFRPEYFEPFFGDQFTELSGKKLTSASVKLTGSCERDARFSELVGGAGGIGEPFLNLPGFTAADVAITEISYALLERWSASAGQYLTSLPLETGDPATVELIAARAANVLSILWPREQEAFAFVARAELGRLVTPRLEQQLQALLDTASASDAQSLLPVSSFLTDNQALIDKLNEDDQNEIAALYQSKTDAFLKTDLDKQIQTLQSLAAGKAALELSAAWYRQHEVFFALFASSPSVNTLYRTLMETRRTSFDAAASELTVEATEIVDRTDLDRFSATYLIPLDTELTESAQVRGAVLAKHTEIVAREEAAREQAFRERFYTPYERSLMTGGFGSVVIPDQLQAPDVQGITFAFVRAREQRGVQRDTPMSITAPEGRVVVTITAARCNPEGSGYRCHYRAIEEIDYAASTFLSIVFDSGAKEMLSFDRSDLFEMTTDGWQSTTIADWLEQRAQALARLQEQSNNRNSAGSWDDWEETKRQAKEHQDMIDLMITLP